MKRHCNGPVYLILSTADALSSEFLSPIIMTNADKLPNLEGQEIIAHSMPSFNENNDTQGLDDAAELPFGQDDAEDEEHHRFSNQIRELVNKRNMLILLFIAAIVFFCFVTGISSAALTANNNSVVVESFNGAAGATAKSTKAPTAKSTKAPVCTPSTTVFGDSVVPPGGNCALCCDDCPIGYTNLCGKTNTCFCTR